MRAAALERYGDWERGKVDAIANVVVIVIAPIDDVDQICVAKNFEVSAEGCFCCVISMEENLHPKVTSSPVDIPA